MASTLNTTAQAEVTEALERVGAALVNAREAVTAEQSAPRAAEDALLALCGAAYAALSSWEDVEEPIAEVAITTWRTPLDELRVQTALAEMELRDAGLPLAAVHDLVSGVTDRLSAARHDIGAAVEALRAAVRRERS